MSDNKLNSLVDTNFDENSEDAFAKGEDAVTMFGLSKRKWTRGKTGRKALHPEWAASVRACKITHPDWTIKKLASIYKLSESGINKILKANEMKAVASAPAVDAFLMQEMSNKTLASKALGKYLAERYESGDIKAADASVFATIIEKTFQRERLINGLSTENQAVQFKWQE